jgi:hypothetical protein
MSEKLLNDNDRLVKKWGKILEGIDSPHLRKATAQLYENQARHIVLRKEELVNEAMEGATTTGSIGTFQKWALPMVRRIYPNLIANNFVSQQPMPGPVSQVFYLGAGRQYGGRGAYNPATGQGRQSIFSKYQLTYRNFTASAVGDGSTDLDTTPSPTFSTLYNRTKGSASTTYGGSIAGWPDPTTILGYSVSAGEFLSGSAIPEVNLSIEQQPVVARTRKMRTLWTLEANQDLKAYHDLNLEQELTTLMTDEFKLEIDRELIEDLRGIAYDSNIANGIGGWYRNALDNTTMSNNFGNIGGKDPQGATGFTPVHFLWDFNNGFVTNNTSGTANNVWVIDFTSSALPFAPQHIGHVYANLLAVINFAAQDIYSTTHRSPGSVLLTSPKMGAILQIAAQLNGGMERADGPSNMGNGQISFKGKLAGQYDLYIDPLYPEDEILMARKPTNPMDTGFIYCPYIPLELLPNVIDPETFQPRKGIMSRYGKIAIAPESRHYRIIRVVGPVANYMNVPFGKASGNAVL